MKKFIILSFVLLIFFIFAQQPQKLDVALSNSDEAIEVKKLLLQILAHVNSHYNYHMQEEQYKMLKEQKEKGDPSITDKELYKVFSEKHASTTRTTKLIKDILFHLNHDFRYVTGMITEFTIDGNTLTAQVDLKDHGFLDTPTILVSISGDQIDVSTMTVIITEASADGFKVAVHIYQKNLVDLAYLRREHITVNWIAVEGVGSKHFDHGHAKSWIQGKGTYTPIQIRFEPMAFVASSARANVSRTLGFVYVRPKYKKNMYAGYTNEPKELLIKQDAQIHWLALDTFKTSTGISAGRVPYSKEQWKVVSDEEAEKTEAAKTLAFQSETDHVFDTVVYDDQLVAPHQDEDFVFPTIQTVQGPKKKDTNTITGPVQRPFTPPILNIAPHVVSPDYVVPTSVLPPQLYTHEMMLPVEELAQSHINSPIIPKNLPPTEVIVEKEVPKNIYVARPDPIAQHIVINPATPLVQQQNIAVESPAKIIEQPQQIVVQHVEKVDHIINEEKPKVEMETYNIWRDDSTAPSVVNNWIWSGRRWIKLEEEDHEEKCYSNNREVPCCPATIDGQIVYLPCEDCRTCDALRCMSDEYCKFKCGHTCLPAICRRHCYENNNCKGDFCQQKCKCGHTKCDIDCANVKDCVFNEQCRRDCSAQCKVTVCAQCKKSGCKSEFCKNLCKCDDECSTLCKNSCEPFLCQFCPHCKINCDRCNNTLACIINPSCKECNCSKGDFCAKCVEHLCPVDKCKEHCPTQCEFCNLCDAKNCQFEGCFDRCPKQCITKDCITDCPDDKCVSDKNCRVCPHCQEPAFCAECMEDKCGKVECLMKCGGCNETFCTECFKNGFTDAKCFTYCSKPLFCKQCEATFYDKMKIEPETCKKCENLPLTCQKSCIDPVTCRTNYCKSQCKDTCPPPYETATIRVDLKPYSFTTTPLIITTVVYTSVDGVTKRSEFMGSSSVYEVSKDGFTVTIRGIPLGESPKLSLHWIATFPGIVA